MKTTPVHQRLKHRLKPTRRNIYQKPVRDVNELKQRLIETWSATNRASLIKQLINGKIVLMRVSKPKENIEHMTFKAYVIAVMNKLTCFVSQGRVRTAVRKSGQFCCSFVANLLQ